MYKFISFMDSTERALRYFKAMGVYVDHDFENILIKSPETGGLEVISFDDTVAQKEKEVLLNLIHKHKKKNEPHKR